ncbi:hypothetical protein SISNIDRAFT_482868 [Sistotremastrum niveocremeum HHB9708]|uniref:Uncharacterized protein n=1 Tax=Sistotremastrum niveocremeum HHB9708 TaxID=1314777 RepID=A0A164XTN2_9AGAM|nr:hypothetical protein SISNIDRAFT_482868 [Sistotremastrum niveocremeum HHB9708]
MTISTSKGVKRKAISSDSTSVQTSKKRKRTTPITAKQKANQIAASFPIPSPGFTSGVVTAIPKDRRRFLRKALSLRLDSWKENVKRKNQNRGILPVNLDELAARPMRSAQAQEQASCEAREFLESDPPPTTHSGYRQDINGKGLVAYFAWRYMAKPGKNSKRIWDGVPAQVMRHAHWATQRFAAQKLMRVITRNSRHIRDGKIDAEPYMTAPRSTDPADANAVRDIRMAEDKDTCYFDAGDVQETSTSDKYHGDSEQRLEGIRSSSETPPSLSFAQQLDEDRTYRAYVEDDESDESSEFSLGQDTEEGSSNEPATDEVPKLPDSTYAEMRGVTYLVQSWHETGHNHDPQSMMKSSSDLTGGPVRVANGKWLLLQLSLLHEIISMMFKAAFPNEWKVYNAAYKAGITWTEDVQDLGAFLGRGIVWKLPLLTHRDGSDGKGALCAIVNWGYYRAGDEKLLRKMGLVLHDLKLLFEYPPGSVIIFRSSDLWHSFEGGEPSPYFEGDELTPGRFGFVFFMPSGALNTLKGKPPGWARDTAAGRHAPPNV